MSDQIVISTVYQSQQLVISPAPRQAVSINTSSSGPVGPPGPAGPPGATSLNFESPLMYDNTTNTVSLENPIDGLTIEGGNF